MREPNNSLFHKVKRFVFPPSDIVVSSGQRNPQGPEGIVCFRGGMLRQWLSLSVSQTRPQKPLSVPISVDENVNGNRRIRRTVVSQCAVPARKSRVSNTCFTFKHWFPLDAPVVFRHVRRCCDALHYLVIQMKKQDGINVNVYLFSIHPSLGIIYLPQGDLWPLCEKRDNYM